MTHNLISHPVRTALAAVLLVLTVAATMAGAGPAYAADGDPFSTVDGKIFLSQENPTSLYEFVQTGSDAGFKLVGGSTYLYNAIGFNTKDGYVYGIGGVAKDGAKTELLRIGQGGVVTSLGSVGGLLGPEGGYNQGTFGTGTSANILYVRDSGAANRLWAVTVPTAPATTPATATLITLERNVPPLSDMVFRNGFLWGVDGIARMWRINPGNGVATVWDVSSILPATNFGAQWIYGNGNIGLSDNKTGKIYQISLTGPSTDTPTFTLVSVVNGQGSGNNDGTAVPGKADLGIVKSAPRVYPEGGKIDYTLTVTNHGPGTSTGSIVEDQFPNTFWTRPNITTTTPGCSFDDTSPYPRKMTCLVGTLAVGESWVIEVTAQTYSNNLDRINTATVTGNEQDEKPANNTSTFTSIPARLGIVKSVTPTTATKAGQQVTYSFVVTNQSKAALKNVTVHDTLAAPAAPALTVNCPKTTLAGGTDTNVDGESMTCKATYTVTQADVDKGRIDNKANATSTAVLDGSSWRSNDSSAVVTITQTPGLSVVKSANVTEVTAVGQSIDYSFLVTNTGNVTLSDIAVDDQLAAPAGPALEVSCPATTLAPAGTMTCTAPYTVTQADMDKGSIDNTATAKGKTPSGKEVPSGPSKVTVPATQTPGITVVKSANVVVVTAAGQSIDYSFLVTNTGNVTLSDVAVDDELAAPAGPALTVTCPASVLAPAADMTCTASYTVTKADMDHGSIDNTAIATGKTPSGKDVPSEPSKVTVPVAGITVVKSANVVVVTAAGQSIDYSFLVTNTGNVTLSDIAVNDQLAAPAGPALTVSCPETTLAPAGTTTCTASYTVTQADMDKGSIDNTATATGKTPSGKDVPSEPSKVTVTTSKGPKIPMTGGTGAALLTAAGLGILGVFAATFLARRKRS